MSKTQEIRAYLSRFDPITDANLVGHIEDAERWAGEPAAFRLTMQSTIDVPRWMLMALLYEVQERRAEVERLSQGLEEKPRPLCMVIECFNPGAYIVKGADWRTSLPLRLRLCDEHYEVRNRTFDETDPYIRAVADEELRGGPSAG